MNAIDAAPASVAERRITVWLFLGALCVLLVFQYGGVSGLDGETMYASARALVDDRSLDVGPGFNTLPGNGGGEYARPNFGLPLVAAVIYLLTAPVDWLLPAYADFVRAAAVGASMAVVGAALVVAAFRLARRLGARLWPALVAGVGTVAGTFLLPYSKEFFTEPVAALTTIFAIERALAGRSLSAGVGAAAAGAVRAASFLFAPLVILVILRRRGIREAVIASVPVAAAGILTVGYNLARFGHPLHFGYQDAEFSTPFFEGARFLLFDPSYSVAIFAPAIVLVPSALVHLRHNRDALLLLVGNFAAVFALNATWLSPRGGWSWGPRLLIPGVVPLIAALGPWLNRTWNRRVAVLLFCLGFAVAAPAMVVSTQMQQLDEPFPFHGPTVVRQAELVPPTAAYTVEHLYEGADDGRNYLRFLTLWQVALARVAGPPGLVLGGMATIVLLVGATWAAWNCRVAYREAQTIGVPL